MTFVLGEVADGLGLLVGPALHQVGGRQTLLQDEPAVVVHLGLLRKHKYKRTVLDTYWETFLKYLKDLRPVGRVAALGERIAARQIVPQKGLKHLKNTIILYKQTKSGLYHLVHIGERLPVWVAVVRLGSLGAHPLYSRTLS